MICSNCHNEYREGYVRCPDCDVALVDAEPEPPATAEVRLVKVYETGNPAIIPIVESLLMDGGIEFMTKGEPIQDLFGWGRFGTALNFVIGPVEFYVREDDAEDARRIFEQFKEPVPALDDP